MREEEALSGYDQDLSLIISEIDRLNRTVSQLLAFSRPSHADTRPVQLSDLINATVTLASTEAKERGKQMRFLAARGFSGDTVRRVLTGSQDDE